VSLESNRPSLSPRAFAALNAVVSTAALGFLVWLVYFHEPAALPDAARGSAGTRSPWPALNASFNALAAALLLVGRAAIRRGQRSLHQRLMLAALAASALFLAGYVYYHSAYGDTRFQGEGLIRPVYFFVLISHIGLSAVVFPAILWTLYLALSERIALHRRVARWTWAGWLYVSVTGVVIFLMLHAIRWS